MMIFAAGSNGSGQLGIGHRHDVSVPKPIAYAQTPSSPIVKVAAGGNHTLLLTETGDVFRSGDVTSGACGPGAPVEDPCFQKMELPPEVHGPVVLIAATWEASVLAVKDSDGRTTELYSLGMGTRGELGLGELIVRTPRGSRIGKFPPAGTQIIDLAACMSHVVAVLDNGDVYGWGNGRKGQLGRPAAVVHEPRKMMGLDFEVTRAVCCKEATCVFGKPASGQMRIVGSDKWQVQSAAPRTAPAWEDVGASWSNIYILKPDGGLDSWGRNDHGQLPPPNLPPLETIAIGSEHVLALSNSGDALAWGWGEHGNCGPSSDVDIKGRWNVVASSKYIPRDSRIIRVGAGCATSWVFIGTG